MLKTLVVDSVMLPEPISPLDSVVISQDSVRSTSLVAMVVVVVAVV